MSERELRQLSADNEAWMSRPENAGKWDIWEGVDNIAPEGAFLAGAILGWVGKVSGQCILCPPFLFLGDGLTFSSVPPLPCDINMLMVH